MTKSCLFDHSWAVSPAAVAQAVAPDGAAGKAVGPRITLKIRLGRGEGSCAPAAPGQIEVTQSSGHFNLGGCSASRGEINQRSSASEPYLTQT